MNNRYLYAQIDSNGLVISKSDLSKEVSNHQLIPVQSFDGFDLGDSYIAGEFVPKQLEEGA
ncbi:hypothetical protein [Shewanella psychrotolerans]|uniref:hypothetical protein n=1 Tax=Shewanella psychrotolerans TaxID=2864206 RepID=UPI001C657456|nr:hypothetical protein [Shewanella psychrotolerans]QYK03125.1 hypothetical protein K0I62_09495 [Shewanella psychrotolerans]